MSANGTGRIFTACFATSATTAAVDIVSLLSTAASKFAVRALDIFAISTNVAGAEGVAIELWRTTGSSAANGAAITPRNVRGHSGAPAAVTGAAGPSGTQFSTGGTNAAKLFQGTVAADGLRYRPDETERLEFTTAAPRFHVRAVAPVALTPGFVGVVTFEELGRNPSS